jgi:RNA polymerase sigma-70 factor, ECF subfamily
MMENTIRNKEDQRLLAKLKKGEQDAFAALYDRYAPVLYGIIFKMTAEQDRAEEILKVVFININKELPEFNASNISLFTRMMQITRSTTLEEVKVQQIKPANKTARLNNFVVAVDYERKFGKEHSDNKEMELFNLIYYNGYSYEEAASALKLPVTEISARIRNEIKKLCETGIDENN